MAAASGITDAQKKWELENNVKSGNDNIYVYNQAEQQSYLQQKPWTKDPNYFKNVKMSALALIKIVMHAKSGGNLEVMGLMNGKIDINDPAGPTFIVMDSFPLPVEGTETRVNAQAEAYEYMVDFQTTAKQGGRLENVVGWYHSHPGYGCWMSGIDCATQMLNQKFQEPWLAVVIDPVRTCASGKVEIGAFRTYPEGHKPATSSSEYQHIPLEKIEDFGVHQNQYYPLDINFFKSTTDAQMLSLLWNKYWINTLSSSSLLANGGYATKQIMDLANKMEQAEGQLSHSARAGLYIGDRKEEESMLSKICKDSSKVSREHIQAVMSQTMKFILFQRDFKNGAAEDNMQL